MSEIRSTEIALLVYGQSITARFLDYIIIRVDSNLHVITNVQCMPCVIRVYMIHRVVLCCNHKLCSTQSLPNSQVHGLNISQPQSCKLTGTVMSEVVHDWSQE